MDRAIEQSASALVSLREMARVRACEKVAQAGQIKFTHTAAPSRREKRKCATAMAVVLVMPMLLLIAAGCDDMKNQPRYEPLEESHFFDNGQSSRTPVADTVAQGQLRIDDAMFKGRVDGKPVDTFPFEITMSDMQRGKERYDIFCGLCHGPAGDGNGMIVQRGLTPPPSLHLDRLRNAPVGHFYEVMTNGYGAMFSYASRISVEDRWRIAAYIRALQLSQHAPAEMAGATTQPTGEAAQ